MSMTGDDLTVSFAHRITSLTKAPLSQCSTVPYNTTDRVE